MSFSNREIDSSSGARYEWDGGGLVAFAEDAQGAMSALEREVFDVGSARFGDSESVQREKDREGGVVAVEALGGEQERTELGAVHPAPLTRLHLGATDVLAGFDAMRPSM